VTEDDAAVVELFAALLRASIAEDSDDVQRRMLRQRVAAMDDALSSYPASRVALPAEVRVHNQLIIGAQARFPQDSVIATLSSAVEDGTETGLLRLNLLQILAVT
jgi:hypothetical protein